MKLEEFKVQLNKLFPIDDIDVKINGNYYVACFYPEPFANNYPIVAHISTHIVGDYVVSTDSPVLAPRTDMALVRYLVKAFANTPLAER